MQTTQDHRLVTFHRLPDDPVQNVELFECAWGECIELQVQDKATWLGQVLVAMGSIERYEIAVVHKDRVVGAVVLAADPWDAHVGTCFSVFAQYVLPQYRNVGISRKLMREALLIARRGGAGVLAFTHRKAPWRYETIYRRIK